VRALLSTSSGWNCGDDWIRDGLLHALRLRPDVDTIWWNRGWGVDWSFANSPGVNLPLIDYVIMAGTPEWIDQNEAVYRYALANDIPIALLGVGRDGCRKDHHDDMMQAVADSGLVEVAIVRDETARDLLAGYGIDSQVMCDPAMFKPPVVPPGGDEVVVGWRGLNAMTPDERHPGPNDAKLDDVLWRTWVSDEGRKKRVIVHDNREVAGAEALFHIARYSSDHDQIFRLYGDCGRYVGARIHGFVAALIHGGSAHLVYNNRKAVVAETVIKRLWLEDSAAVTYLKEVDRVPDLKLVPPVDIWRRIRREEQLFRTVCHGAPGLSRIMEGGR